MSLHPKYLSIEDFIYTLPEEKIAFYPLREREASKLLIYNKGEISEDTYRYIDKYLPAESLMVFNNTKVVEARMLFQKPTGGMIEIFCLDPHEQYPDVSAAMAIKKRVKWLCLIGGASKWKKGMVLIHRMNYGGKELLLEAHYLEKRSDCFVIELIWNDEEMSFAEVLHQAGKVPLPPYIKREAEDGDAERYQTTYARFDGSVAAPTAGLHFTQNVLNNLKQKEIDTDFVTLHVGAGTFKPVKSETMEGHQMHAEYIEVNKSLIEKLLIQSEKPIVAVGTTSMRTIESLYWLGCKLLMNPSEFDNQLPFVSQWEVYQLENEKISLQAALERLIFYLETNKKERLLARTQIIIAPGYSFKLTNGLVTNFHQPASTLLLLVSAFIGNDWRKVYDYALNNDFRFLSYGDGSLLMR
ncbi:MAG TPA: S-adenosylmethionine:tRNA ribosyltransferase-isomerase [Niabella sp.]|jgi:S-adenosylmethionine:tRNA ribosyltransferase-isomerase|nr:S-adenosylmethionine:tRNA ribosyltransferase-isomerase [Chitinophagaceae bacterium]HRO84817.1 S-adenosylmethionine:tRNA ribosyltransferase-isomerase [Niabella sp.]